MITTLLWDVDGTFLDLIPKLNLRDILEAYGGATRGNVPYDPRMLTGLLWTPSRSI